MTVYAVGLLAILLAGYNGHPRAELQPADAPRAVPTSWTPSTPSMSRTPETSWTSRTWTSGTWTSWTVADGLPAGEVRVIHVRRDGRVYVGVRGSGLTVWDGTNWLAAAQADELAGPGVADIVEHDETLWVVGPGGYSVQSANGWTTFRDIGGLTTNVVFTATPAAGRDRTSAIWLGANGFAARHDATGWTHFAEDDGLPHRVVHQAHTDRDGQTWFACRRGLAVLSNGEIIVKYLDVNFRSILESADGSLWFGTSDGVLEHRGDDWTWHQQGMTLLPKVADSTGGIWAVSEGDGAFYYNGELWQQFTTDNGLLSDTVYDAALAPNGAVWFATAAGVSRLVPGETDELQVTLIGNAGVALSDGTTTLLVDMPYQSGAFGYQRYDFASLETQGDVVSVITHHHDDHFDASLFEERAGWRVVGPPSVMRQVARSRVVHGDEVLVGRFAITVVPSPHTPDHRSYRVGWKDHVFYFVGDTESTKELRGQEGIDLLFITPWLSCTVDEELTAEVGGVESRRAQRTQQAWRELAPRAIAYHLRARGGDRVCGPVETVDQGSVVTFN